VQAARVIDRVAQDEAHGLPAPGELAGRALVQEGRQPLVALAGRATLEQLAHDGRQGRVDLDTAIGAAAVPEWHRTERQAVAELAGLHVGHAPCVLLPLLAGPERP
jgi:hypothetical protein